MKAIVRETYGPPDVLHLEEVPLPTVRDGDVLVRVRAASANAGDWHLLRGTPLPFRLVAGLRTPKFKIIGTDVAGHVEAVGRSVTQFRPGDETKWKWRPAQQMPIASVRGCCANSDQHVAVTECRHRNIFKMQHVGRSVRLPDDGFHSVTPTMSASDGYVRLSCLSTGAYGVGTELELETAVEGTSALVKSQARAPAAPTSYARHHAGHQAGTPAFATMWP